MNTESQPAPAPGPEQGREPLVPLDTRFHKYGRLILSKRELDNEDEEEKEDLAEKADQAGLEPPEGPPNDKDFDKDKESFEDSAFKGYTEEDIHKNTPNHPIKEIEILKNKTDFGQK